MHSKELWLVQENHATDKLNSKSFSWKPTVKAELSCKIQNLKENSEKIKAVFVIRAALWTDVALNTAGVERTRLGKLAVAFNTERHSIRVLH